MPQLNRARLGGWIAFPDPVEIDFDALPSGIVAIVGDNGAGKSTLAELLGPGSFFGELPTRGALADIAVSREAFVETDWTLSGGLRVRLRHVVDGKGRGRKSTVFLIDTPEKCPTPRALTTEFEAWGGKNLPGRDLFLSTDFLAQKSAGLLDLDVAKRKAMMLGALGLLRHERYAVRCSGEAKAASLRLTTVTAEEQGASRRAVDPAAATEEVIRAQDAHATALRAATQAKDALAQARYEATTSATAADDFERAERILREATAAATAIDDEINALEADLSRLDREVAAGEEAETAQAKIAGLEEAERLADERVTATRAERDATRDRRNEAQTAFVRCGTDLPALRKLAAELAPKAAKVEGVRLLAAKVEATGKVWQDAQKAALAAAAELSEAKTLALSSSDQRLGAFHAGVGEAREYIRTQQAAPVVFHGTLDAVAERLGGLLSGDDEAAKLATAARGKLTSFPAEVRRLEDAVRPLAREADAATAAARELPALEEIAKRADETTAAIEATEIEVAAARVTFSATEEPARVAGEAFVAAQTALHEAKNALRQTREKAAGAGAVKALRARREEREKPHADLARRAREAAKKLDETPKPGEAPKLPDLDGFAAALATAEAAERRAANAVAVAEDAERRAIEAAAALAEIRERRTTAEKDVEEWTLLAEAWGRDGIQAREIDAAGPEVSAIANDLLVASYGPRFSLRLATTVPNKGGGEREVYDVVVTDEDSPKLEWRPSEGVQMRYKSGGEATNLGEALALALSTFGSGRIAAEGATWFRDESGAALAPKRGPLYVAMLRRAMALARAGRTLLVTHSEAVQALCDARLLVEGGKIRLV